MIVRVNVEMADGYELASDTIRAVKNGEQCLCETSSGAIEVASWEWDRPSLGMYVIVRKSWTWPKC